MFKKWLETWTPPQGKPIIPQNSNNIILHVHPFKPNLFYEPIEEPLKDAGEWSQKVKLYSYNSQRNELAYNGIDILYLDDLDANNLKTITITNPIRVYK